MKCLWTLKTDNFRFWSEMRGRRKKIPMLSPSLGYLNTKMKKPGVILKISNYKTEILGLFAWDYRDFQNFIRGNLSQISYPGPGFPGPLDRYPWNFIFQLSILKFHNRFFWDNKIFSGKSKILLRPKTKHKKWRVSTSQTENDENRKAPNPENSMWE